VNLRGSVEPADYKRYVLPIIFLRFLSLRYEKRRAELERAIQKRWTGPSRIARMRRPPYGTDAPVVGVAA
jgi:type I restriction-modification system DNA methylase subunit